MALWKIQRWTPDTCDDPPCQILQLWDAEALPQDRTHPILAVERACSAHPTTANLSKARWPDGRYFDRDTLIEQQREWFRWRAGVRPSEPAMPAEVAAPSAGDVASIDQVYTWVQGHNQRWNLSRSAMVAERTDLDTGLIIFWFTGTGDTRVLHVDSQGQLSNPQITRIQSALDIQFGVGSVIVEG